MICKQCQISKRKDAYQTNYLICRECARANRMAYFVVNAEDKMFGRMMLKQQVQRDELREYYQSILNAGGKLPKIGKKVMGL